MYSHAGRVWQLVRAINFLLSVSLFSFISSSALAATTAITGYVEAEYGSMKDFDGNTSSDIITSTVELSIDAEISEWFSGHVVLLHEEDDTPLEVDQGYITYGNTFLSSFSIKIGQQYLPFGAFESNMVSDPLTLEIGETRESAIIFSYDSALYASFYLFNGDMNEAGGDDSVDSMGFNLGWAYEGEDLNFDLGVSYISNLKDSDGLSGGIIEYREAINEVVPDSFPAPEEVNEYVAGFGAHLTLNWGSFTFIGEVVAAMDNFEADELAPNQRKPSATNLEFAYGITDDLSLAFGMQNTVDMAGYLPESRILFVVSYALDEATGFAFEYSSSSDYGSADGGTGNTGSGLMLHLGTSF